MALIDWIVLGGYLVASVAFGLWSAGKPATLEDYFVGGRQLPWWAVCLSIVATETSTLTVISLPGIAYGGSLVFLQLAIGYIIGRSVVAWWLLPKYADGKLLTAYQFLGERFGRNVQGLTSVTFLVTRLLADGVRLFATAIPIKVVLDLSGVAVGYWQIIVVLGIVTIIYTLVGGIKAVVWMDVLQMTVYVGGGLVALFFLASSVGGDIFGQLSQSGKTVFIDLDVGVGKILTTPYTFITAVVGGAILSMASHGTDNLIVQRLLTCKSLQDSRKAMIYSGVAVFVQFFLFLSVGLLLWLHYDGASLAGLGLQRGDELFPRYIVSELPPGVAGLLIAGIVAAAMSTLSSSLNSLASSSVVDIAKNFFGESVERIDDVVLSRIFTFVWGLIFILFASSFADRNDPVVELGLSIASFTYGALLGIFVLGSFNNRINEVRSALAFIVTLVGMILIIKCVWYSASSGWTWNFFPSKEYIAMNDLKAVAWPWYTAIGASLCYLVGALFSIGSRTADKQA